VTGGGDPPPGKNCKFILHCAPSKMAQRLTLPASPSLKSWRSKL